jgi:hypothetical protein
MQPRSKQWYGGGRILQTVEERNPGHGGAALCTLSDTSSTPSVAEMRLCEPGLGKRSLDSPEREGVNANLDPVGSPQLLVSKILSRLHVSR